VLRLFACHELALLSLRLPAKKNKADVQNRIKYGPDTPQNLKFCFAKNRSKLYNISRNNLFLEQNIIHPDYQTRLYGLGEMYDEKIY